MGLNHSTGFCHLMPHFKKALLESYNSREVHFHIEGNPGFSSVPFFYVSILENHPPSLHLVRPFRKQGSKKEISTWFTGQKSAWQRSCWSLWRTSCRECTFMIDFHWSQTDCSVVIFLTRNCSHCSSLLSAGCLNYNSLCPCYLLHKLLTLVSFSMQIHQFYSPS